MPTSTTPTAASSAGRATLGGLRHRRRQAGIHRVGAGQIRARRLKLGVVGDRDAEVISGLSKGEQVVVRGGLALKALLLNHTSR